MTRDLIRVPEGKCYACASCHVPLASKAALISKQFQGRNGRAYLFSRADNVRYGPAEDRMLMTGMHRVADVLCGVCGGPLGWTYYEAFEESQRYKEGKVILEKAKLCKKG